MPALRQSKAVESVKNSSVFEDESLYIGDVVSTEELVSVINQHSRLCPMNLQVNDVSKNGHVLMQVREWS